MVQITPSPTPSETPIPIATSIISDQTAIKTYRHNRFRIDHPEHWQVFERPDGVIFVEPNNQAGYSVVFSDVGTSYNEQELKQYLITFVAQNFANESSNFKAISQEHKPDGSVIAQFSSIDPNFGQAISQVRVLQKDTLVFVVYFNVAEEQWAISEKSLQTLSNTFQPLDSTPLSAIEPTDESPIWALIGPTEKTFGFLYADDWQILEQSQNLISVGQPENGMFFTVSRFAWPQARIDPKAAEKAALAHIETLSATYQAVQNLPPSEFPLHTESGATIDFIYTTEGENFIAGSVITAVHNGKMYKVVFTAPSDFYEAALQWFNPMYKSFKFLEPETFMKEE